MKQIFFGIALILFALVLLLSEIWLPIVGDLMSRGEFAVLIAVIGLVIAGMRIQREVTQYGRCLGGRLQN